MWSVAEPARFSPQAGSDVPENGLFRNIAERGYSALLPIVPPGATISERSTLFARKDAVGKIPGIRGGDGAWRGFDWLKHVATPDDYGRWSAWGAGVGLRLGNGLLAIDCDTLDQTQAEYVSFAFSEAFGVQQPVRRFGRRPKWLSLVRCAEEVKYTRVEFTGYDGLKERVELLGQGRQCVVAGIHPGTSRPYEWDTADGLLPALEALPAVTAGQIGQFFAMLASALPGCSKPVHEGGDRPLNQDLLRGEIDDVKRAVSVLPNRSCDFPTRNDYLRVGYAIKAALPDDPDEAQDLWLQWCGRWSDDPSGRSNEPEKVLQDWRRMKPPYSLGAGWLYETADRLGGFDVGSVWFEPLEEKLEFGLDTEPVSGGAGAGAGVGNISGSALKTYPIVTVGSASDTWNADGPEPLVKGLLDKHAFSVFYGQSNVGKTFVVMDLAAHIAMGRPWGGMRTSACGVAYVVAEGSRGALKRAAAMVRKYGAELKGAPFRLILSPVDLRNAAADLPSLVAAIREMGDVGLVVVDTLSRALAGGDENAPGDMGGLVKNFDALRKATNAHLLVVHHTGKDENRGMRGHSLLKGAIDTEVHVKEGEIGVTKQRDMEKNVTLRFSLEDCELGVDRFGEPVKSATVRLLDAAEGQRQGEAATVTAGREQEVYEAILALEEALDGQRTGTTYDEILAHLDAQKSAIKTKEAIRTYVRRLSEKKVIYPASRGRWKSFVYVSRVEPFESETVQKRFNTNIPKSGSNDETVQKRFKSGSTVFD